MKFKSKKTSGITLVEFAVSLVILSIVTSSVAIMLNHTAKTATRTFGDSQFYMLTHRSAQQIIQKLTNAKLWGLYQQSGNSHVWQMAKKTPQEGECIEYSKLIVTSHNSKSPGDYVHYLRLVVGDEKVYEKDLQQDLDNNGHTNDFFYLCFLEEGKLPEQRELNHYSATKKLSSEIRWNKFSPIQILYRPNKSKDNPFLPMFCWKNANQLEIQILFFHLQKQKVLPIRQTVYLDMF